MCGRFTLRTPTNVLVQQFLFDTAPELSPRYNIAPTQEVAAVRLDEDRQRELAMLHWGLIPSWADDAKIGNRMINARAESVADKPAYRAAFKRRRCLIPADGFYEWKAAEKKGERKQPFLFHMDDHRPFAFAGLWETWKDKEDADAQPIQSCTIITTNANDLAANVHDRMPVILDSEDYEMWLDPEFEDRDRLTAMLRPYDGDDLVADPVSTRVNSPQNDDPDCVEVQEQKELF